MQYNTHKNVDWLHFVRKQAGGSSFQIDFSKSAQIKTDQFALL